MNPWPIKSKKFSYLVNYISKDRMRTNSMAIVNATIFFEKCFWVETFERTDKEGYAVARHILVQNPQILKFMKSF